MPLSLYAMQKIRDIMNQSNFLYKSKYPITGYIGIVLYLIVFGSIFYNVIFNKFSIIYGLGIFFLAAFFIDILLCGYAGKIILMPNNIEVKYFFPWREKISKNFNRIISIETSSLWGSRKGLYREVFIEDDINGKYSFKIHTFYGSFEDITEFEILVKSIYRIE